MYKIIFFGTSDFAVPSLKALAMDERFEIVGVVTQPDRAVGRHHTIEEGVLKKTALKLKITNIWQPEKLKDEPFASWLREAGSTCDIFVIVSYGKILPQWLLDLPQKGVVNVHSSLLPRWRGASPVQATIAAGDKVTGISIMKIDEQMDHGPLIAQMTEPVLATDTAETLYHRLFEIGGKALPDVLNHYLSNDVQLIEQDHTQATYCKILTRDDGKIDWSKSAVEIECLVRAYTPWPGTWTEWNGKRLKILSVSLVPTPSVIARSSSDAAIFISNHHLYATCGDNSLLELVTVQPEGKKPMPGGQFDVKN